MHTTPEEASQLVALIQNGLRQRELARTLNMTRAAVRRVCQRHKQTGSFHRRHGTGRKRCTINRDDRFIVSTSLRDRRLNAVQVQQQLREIRGVAISQWTIDRIVRRRLQESDLLPKTPAIGPKLSPAQWRR